MPKSQILQSVVERVAAKLNLEGASLQEVEDEFRRSKTLVRIGQLPNDSAENRAAVLLQSHKRLTMKQVSGAVGVNIKKLEVLQNRLRNYTLAAPATNQRKASSKQQPKAPTTATASRKRVLRDRPTGTYAPQLLSSMVLRLAGFLNDPRGVEKAARRLMERIHAYQPPTSSEMRGHHHDLQRYAAAFEAACVIHVVSQESNDSTNSMGVEDVVQVSDGATTALDVKYILPRVKELALKFASQAPPKKKPEKKKEPLKKDTPWDPLRVFVEGGGSSRSNEHSSSRDTAHLGTWQEQIFRSAIEQHGSLASAAEHVFRQHGIGMDTEIS